MALDIPVSSVGQSPRPAINQPATEGLYSLSSGILDLVFQSDVEF